MGTTFLWPLLIAFVLGYLCGSIPFGLILTRAAGLGDVRAIGSGNIGATNVLRTGNKGLAAATLLLDMLKGAAAVLLTIFVALRWLVPMVPAEQAHIQTLIYAAPWAAALGAVCGHVFPVWLGFQGGKGVATYLGALVVLHPYAAFGFAGIWLLVAAGTRYSSVSSLVASVAVLGFFLLLAPGSIATMACMLLTGLIFWKHRENIRRLIAGQESRIGSKG